MKEIDNMGWQKLEKKLEVKPTKEQLQRRKEINRKYYEKHIENRRKQGREYYWNKKSEKIIAC